MARLLYTLLLTGLLPFAFLRLWWKGRKQPAYRERWSERLGWPPPLPKRPRLWVHAVSVGETIAAAPLIREWQRKHPDWAVLITTTTPTGSAQVRSLFSDSVEHCYLPFDLPWLVRPFLQNSQPTVALVMETEIWPNLYRQCRRMGIPLLMANARLSNKSFKAYLRLRPLVAPTLQQVSLIATRGAEDASRFIALGASSNAVEPLGNLKFDLAIPPQTQTHAQAWRNWWGAARPVWIAASTHTGEDAQVLAAHQALLATQPSALLVLAPRHPDRADDVAKLVAASGLQAIRRSTVTGTVPPTDAPPPSSNVVLIVDTLGELMTFYAATDLAFVGGSLVPTGGHNPLEPLVLNKPVLSGPHVFNFTELYAELTALGAVALVDSPGDLAQILVSVVTQTASRVPSLVTNWITANQGSTSRLVERIEFLSGQSNAPS